MEKVSISIFLRKHREKKKGNSLVNFDYQEVDSVFSRHHYASAHCVSAPKVYVWALSFFQCVYFYFKHLNTDNYFYELKGKTYITNY